MDRPGVRQVPEGSGEQRKMVKTGCKIICGATTTLAVKGSVITDKGSKPEILSRTAQTTAALTRLKPVWNDRGISLSPKIRLMRSLVTFIFLYCCKSWTITAEPQRRIQAMEMRCRKLDHTKIS